MNRVGKARERFLARPGHGREPASCGGSWEISYALQAPIVTKLCLEVCVAAVNVLVLSIDFEF